MKKISSIVIALIIVLVAVLFIDYQKNGEFVGVFEPKIEYEGEDTLSYSTQTRENNDSKKLKLELKGNEYEFTSGNDCEPSVLALHSIVFDKSINGELDEDILCVQFTAKINAISKLYMSTGYSDFDKLNYRWYTTSGYVYNGADIENEVAKVDVSETLRAEAISKEEYRITFYLGEYFENKKVAANNAIVSLAYLGSETISIYDVKYLKGQESSLKELKIHDADFDWKNTISISLAGGYINSNVEIDELYVTSSFGSFNVDFITLRKYSESAMYYRLELQPKSTPSLGLNTSSQIDVDVYAVYKGVSYKIATEKVKVMSSWTNNH